MRIINHDDQPIEPWRPDVTTRMLVSAAVGSRQLCLFEQWSAPGAGAPTHHHAVEETLTVLEGQAEIWLDGQRYAASAGQTLIVPAGHPHGFRNTGAATLHTLAVLAAPIFEAAYDDARETPRRWLPA
jgi:quercetin dioxygenase-like cupin family protein